MTGGENNEGPNYWGPEQEVPLIGVQNDSGGCISVVIVNLKQIMGGLRYCQFSQSLLMI
jgi:hypothetical protein